MIRLKLVFSALLAGLSLSACSIPPDPNGVFDPHETDNRRVHNFNKALDRKLVGPVAEGYGAAVPAPVDTAISNFAEHVSIPGEMLNSLLQGNAEDFTLNVVRFTTNTLFGLGGLYDFSTAVGIRDPEPDFGQTLHVWGFPEGPYVEIPVFGPSTERDAWGIAADFVLDPLNHILPPGSSKVTVPTYVIDKVGDRHEFASVIEGILYESEDSYVTARSIYLQNRRFNLNGGRDAAEGAVFDELFQFE